MPPPPRSEQPDEAPAELQQLALLPEALLLRDAGCASEGSGVPRLWRATCGGEQVLVRAWEPCGSAGELLQQLRALQRMSRQSKHCARILGATLLDGRRPAAVLQPGGAPLLVPPGGLAAAEALRWGAAVAKALAALHALGLVAHGCLEQIHISDTGETILAGFWLDDLGSETVQQPPAVPAQHGGRHADIHAFGLLLLQLLTGRPLATEGAPPQAAAAKMLQAIQPPLPAQLLQELASLLQRCLEAPASRPAAAELLEELEELQALQAAYRCPGHPGLGSQPLSEAPMLARWLLDCDADSPCGAPGSASGGGGPPDAACWASAGRPQLAGG